MQKVLLVLDELLVDGGQVSLVMARRQDGDAPAWQATHEAG